MAGKSFRVPPRGLPKSDRIMEAGVVLPCNHGMGDTHINFVIDQLKAFLNGGR
jgi:CDP-6-deoxy-D-xylo-4-hexulose-3-dehydrase